MLFRVVRPLATSAMTTTDLGLTMSKTLLSIEALVALAKTADEHAYIKGNLLYTNQPRSEFRDSLSLKDTV